MNIKQLEQATKTMAKIKVIDAKIIDLDKMALHIANGQVEISFSISVTKQKEEESKDVVDDDVYGRKMYYKNIMEYQLRGILLNSSRSNKPQKDTLKIERPIEENVALLMLGVLLGDLQEERNKLINILKKKGVEL